MFDEFFFYSQKKIPDSFRLTNPLFYLQLVHVLNFDFLIYFFSALKSMTEGTINNNQSSSDGEKKQ